MRIGDTTKGVPLQWNWGKEGPLLRVVLILLIVSIYRGLNRGPSNPEADDIPMCHPASM